MFLNSCKKHYILDTQRTVPPEETLARIEKKIATAGITRVADITNLDRIGIPVFSSIRPTAEMGSVSVYNGKGATPTEAKVSAMMEGIERFSAEAAGRDMTMATYGEILRDHKAVNPGDLILPLHADASAPLVWVAGHEINRDEEIYIPAHAVFHPMPRLYPPLFRTNTNGLASGNTREEAVFHALMEVIERDAWSLAEASRRTGSRICDIGDGIAADLLKKFTDAHVEVEIKNITSDIGIPTFAAVSDDTQLKDPTLLTIGMGTHTSARITLLRALTEVAQSRLTQIHGAREDTTVADFRRNMGYERTRRINKYWFDAPDEIAFSSIPSFDSDDFLTDIRYVCEALERSGLDRVIVVDLTRPEIGVPVVRVVVPGLEVYAMDQERSGERCRNARNNRVPRSQS
jgi:ribosomal protein S12 methylthiotransferase accessory factor